MPTSRSQFVTGFVLLLFAAFIQIVDIPDLLSYKKLPGNYRAFLMRYEEDASSTRPYRHKHAIARITFEDGKQVEFRSHRNGSIEWISTNVPLKILVHEPVGYGAKPEYEIDQFMHLYADLLLSLLMTAGGIWSLYLWRKTARSVSLESAADTK